MTRWLTSATTFGPAGLRPGCLLGAWGLRIRRNPEAFGEYGANPEGHGYLG